MTSLRLWKLISRKLIFNFFLLLEKLVNEKYFLINRNIFRSTKNTFQSKEKFSLGNEKHFLINGNNFWSTEKLFGQRKTLSSQKKNSVWFSGKCFSFWLFVFQKVISEKSLSKLSCVCLPLEKLVNGKHFPVKEKFSLVFRKVFS